MSEPSWAEVRAVFEAAAELTGDARDVYLATHATDPALRREVLSLLAVDTAAARFEQPLAVLLAPPEPETLLPAGHRVGPYAIVRVIGRGAPSSRSQISRWIATATGWPRRRCLSKRRSGS